MLANTTLPTSVPTRPILYPDSDGKPMSDNTKQFRWIATLYANLAALYRDHADVFVAGDLLWYPVEGHPEIRIGPDVLVVFGRHKGDRGSYRQWEEDNVPLTVVFEILSPSNTIREIAGKLTFYDEYGIEEYYQYDPDHNHLVVYRRRGATLRRVRKVDSYVSPRLGIRFDLSGPEMVVFHPNGRRFLTLEESEAERARAEQRASTAEQRADRLAELTRRALAQQATPDKLQELQRLLAPPSSPQT
jgi:Uma2 family endonuclease